MHDRVGSPPPRLGASPKLGSVEWAELSWGRRRAPEPPPLDTGAAMATKALHALKEFAAGLPDESSQTAFAAGAEPVYAFCERYKGGLIDNSTGIVCRLIERFLAVERFYPDDRSELLGVTKLSAHHSDNGKTLQARWPSASTATTALLLTPHSLVQAVLSHSQIERKVSVILSLLDFVGVLTKVDQTIHSNSGSGAIALSPTPHPSLHPSYRSTRRCMTC